MPFSTSSGDSQKAIVLGPKGARLREIGTEARREIEALLGTPVYLDLHVTVAKDWQRDPRAAAPARLLGSQRQWPLRSLGLSARVVDPSVA